MATPAERAATQRLKNTRNGPVLPTRVPWVAVIVFVAIAMGLAWAVQLPLWFGEGLADPRFGLTTMAMMFTPALAALIVVLFVKRPASIPRLLGLWPLRPVGRTLGLSLAALVGFPALAFGAMLLGQALGLIELDLVGFSGYQALLAANGAPVAAETLGAIVLTQVLLIPVASLANLPAVFGEELGWRGWLLPNLRPLGVWPALLISGVVWGLWHSPIILLGYNYGRTDAVGVLLMVGWCILLGVVFGWLRLRSASVWPAVFAHAAVNAATGTLLILFTASGSPAGVGGTLLGWSGWILLAVIAVVLAVTGQLRREPQPGLTLAESRPSADAPPATE